MKINFITLWIATIASVAAHINFVSNFDSQRVKEIYNDDPLPIPVIIKSNLETKYNQGISSKFNIKKHELKDTTYIPNLHDMILEDEKVFYEDLPPSEIFDQDKIVFNDYQVLEMREFRLIMNNPTSHFKLCITDIISDTDTIRRIEHRPFPFCLNTNTRYPLHFQFYLTEYKVNKNFFKTSIYIFVDLYEKQGPYIGSRVWPKQVVAKVYPNFLKLQPLEAKNCGKNYTTINIANHEPHHIKINYDSDEDNQEKGVLREVMIPSQKSFKMTLIPKQKIVTISARAFQLSEIQYPKLYMPIYCFDLLKIDSYEIGILNSDRSLYEFPVLVSTNSRQTLQILTIEVISSTETVEILPIENIKSIVEPGRLHKLIGKLILHVNKQPAGKASIILKIIFIQVSNPKQILETQHEYKYFQYKNPLTFGGKRFINVREKKVQKPESPRGVLQNLFTIKNNMNIPLQLVNVIADNEIFKVTWVKELKDYIYPINQRDQIMIEYLGPINLTISPVKYTITLEFNGKMYFPVEFVIYDESLQCVYDNVQQRCDKLPPIDYGYFHNNNTKYKQLVIRNWNPTAIQLQIDLIQSIIEQYGMNFTITIFGPFPNYQMPSHRVNNTLFYYLKGGHFIIVNFAIAPLQNATTGSTIFNLRTPQQSLSSQIKFSFQNGTIALIPQVLRVKNAYERSVEYLNLVSTYSEPYKIKSTSINMSNIHMHARNDTFIYKNQWIGLAVVYEPFFFNITDSCCGNQFAVNNFINALYLSEPRKSLYALIRLQTTTDLQVNSTIIIDNTTPKLIQDTNLTIKLMKTRGYSSVNITIKNIFSQPMKFSVVLTPEYLYRDARQYMLSMRRARKNTEETMFCVNNGITVRHNFSPQMVKTLFNLEHSPQQVTIEPLENSQYYVDSQRRSFQGSSKQFSKYVIDTVNEGARICYRIETSRYVKQLIETKILNDLAESHSNEIFLQFVQKQMEYFNMPFHFLQNDEFYDSLFINFQHYCTASTFPLFRFCKQINLSMSPNQQVVLNPGKQIDIKFEKGNFDTGQIDYSFYLTILNNITKYESHFTSVSIRQPQISIQKMYIDQKTVIQKEKLDQTALKDRDWARLLGKSNFDYKEDLNELNQIKKNTLPILIEENQLTNNTYTGLRTFSIKNTGQVDVYFSHIGIDNLEFRCKNKYIEVLDLCKNGPSPQNWDQDNLLSQFVLPSEKQKNISVKISIPQLEYSNTPKKYNLYFYNNKDYYFKIQLAVKLPESEISYETNYQAIYSLIFNLISMVFIIFIIILRKRESEAENYQINNRGFGSHKNKILGREYYSELGTKIEKKKRKLDIFIDEQILALKEHQDKKLKDFFNSSCESQIEKKYVATEQENSNNNILHDLKHQQPLRNSGILSEGSSIQYIDFNNKSTDNLMNEKIEQSNDDDSQASESDEDSLFEEAGNDTGEHIQENHGWGNQSEDKRKADDNSGSYYNVFLSKNPLKKEKEEPFHWMQQSYTRNQPW